jgi:hypothetical protein
MSVSPLLFVQIVPRVQPVVAAGAGTTITGKAGGLAVRTELRPRLARGKAIEQALDFMRA